MLSKQRKVVVACMLVMLVSPVMPASLAIADNHGAQAPENVVPIRNLLAVLHKDHPGHVLEVELEQEDDNDEKAWIYEVKMLTEKGRVYELEYDATTLQLLNIEGENHAH